MKKSKKKKPKYAINQVTQGEFEPQSIETTNVKATLYSKARATTLKGYKQQHFPKRKSNVPKFQTETKTDQTMNLSTKVPSKDFCTSALMIAKMNLKD